MLGFLKKIFSTEMYEVASSEEQSPASPTIEEGAGGSDATLKSVEAGDKTSPVRPITEGRQRGLQPPSQLRQAA